MSIASQQYANISDNSYSITRNNENKNVIIDGIEYKVIKYVDTPSGYQGAIYQRLDTNDIIVAHRGTEFGNQAIKDGLLADGGMVTLRYNRQAEDAIALTREALIEARKIQLQKGLDHPPEVTVTGHSLGGCLAQITAHYFNLRGETFNAFGAVGLNRRIPEGGDTVINHAMAGDLVSATGRHFGQVRIYARPYEIEALQQTGYGNDMARAELDRQRIGAIKAIGFESHRMHHFTNLDADRNPDISVLGNPQNRLLADAYAPMISKYRGDVAVMRDQIGIGTPVTMAATVAHSLRAPVPAGEPGIADLQKIDDRIEQDLRAEHSKKAIEASNRQWEEARQAGGDCGPAPMQRACDPILDPQRYLNQMLAAYDSGDRDTIRALGAAATQSAPAQALFAGAKAVVDQEESERQRQQEAHMAEMKRQETQQQEQPQAPMRMGGRSL